MESLINSRTNGIVIISILVIVLISCNKINEPKTLHECWIALNQFIEKSEILKIKNGTEKDMIKYHFSLGLYIRNNWIRHGNPALEKYVSNLNTVLTCPKCNTKLLEPVKPKWP